MTGLEASLEKIAGAPVLLIATDFDGTISPIAARFYEAAPDDRAVAAMLGLASLPGTHGAVISGRALADLRARLPRVERAGWILFGSHGAERGAMPAGAEHAGDERLRAASEAAAGEAAKIAGAAVEHKPSGVAFHYRLADEEAALAAVARLEEQASRLGLMPLRGHKVLELCAVRPSKDGALATAKFLFGAQSVLFLGDDLTDEDAFAAMSDSDVAVKIGP